jgi:hypothetical protein
MSKWTSWILFSVLVLAAVRFGMWRGIDRTIQHVLDYRWSTPDQPSGEKDGLRVTIDSVRRGQLADTVIVAYTLQNAGDAPGRMMFGRIWADLYAHFWDRNNKLGEGTAQILISWKFQYEQEGSSTGKVMFVVPYGKVAIPPAP